MVDGPLTSPPSLGGIGETRSVVLMFCPCSERPLICHMAHTEGGGNTEVHWDQADIDYLRRHLTEHHA